jgi:hypothetical protein
MRLESYGCLVQLCGERKTYLSSFIAHNGSRDAESVPRPEAAYET